MFRISTHYNSDIFSGLQRQCHRVASNKNTGSIDGRFPIKVVYYDERFFRRAPVSVYRFVTGCRFIRFMSNIHTAYKTFALWNLRMRCARMVECRPVRLSYFIPIGTGQDVFSVARSAICAWDDRRHLWGQNPVVKRRFVHVLYYFKDSGCRLGEELR